MATDVPDSVSPWGPSELFVCVSQSSPEGSQIRLIAFVAKHHHVELFGVVK